MAVASYRVKTSTESEATHNSGLSGWKLALDSGVPFRNAWSMSRDIDRFDPPLRSRRRASDG
jgi:hypothetical protein